MIVVDDWFVAKHETAHSIMAREFGLALMDVDIDVVTGDGSVGETRVLLFDWNVPDIEDRLIVINLNVLLAGPFFDTKSSGEDIETALSKQPGDKAKIDEMLRVTGRYELLDKAKEQVRDAIDVPGFTVAVEEAATELLQHRKLDDRTWTQIVDRARRHLGTCCYDDK